MQTEVGGKGNLMKRMIKMQRRRMLKGMPHQRSYTWPRKEGCYNDEDFCTYSYNTHLNGWTFMQYTDPNHITYM